MPFTIDFTGRTALVTGGTRGIGLAMARALCEAGANVVIAGRKAETLNDALAQLEPYGDRAAGHQANVGESKERAGLVSFAERRYGGLDFLINNAAANPVFGSIEDTEPWAFAKIMQVNVEAPFELAKLALPLLKKSEAAAVLNVSSIGGLSPEPQLGIYSVSKAALNSLTKVLAKEWGPHGIRVNGLCPGLIQTDFSKALWGNEKIVKHMERATPLGRIGLPEEMGQLAVTVLSEAHAFTTGHLFTSDGGYTI